MIGEGLPPQPACDWVATLDDVEELCAWLGTFRQRLRMARHAGLDTTRLAAVTHELEVRFVAHREEIS